MGQAAVKHIHIYCKYKQLQIRHLLNYLAKCCFSNIFDPVYQTLIYGIYFHSFLTLQFGQMDVSLMRSVTHITKCWSIAASSGYFIPTLWIDFLHSFFLKKIRNKVDGLALTERGLNSSQFFGSKGEINILQEHYWYMT